MFRLSNRVSPASPARARNATNHWTGLQPGQTARFTFRASEKGVFRFACLVPGHEDARMWDVLKIVRGGKPSVVDLRATQGR